MRAPKLIAAVILVAGVLWVSIKAEAEAKRVTDCNGETRTAAQHWSWAKKLRGGYSIPGWAKDKHRFSVVCAAEK